MLHENNNNNNIFHSLKWNVRSVLHIAQVVQKKKEAWISVYQGPCKFYTNEVH